MRIVGTGTENAKGCCAPARGTDATEAPPAADAAATVAKAANAGATEGMIRLDGGRFLMGNEGPEAWKQDGEGPVREVRLDPFWLDRTTVTNAAFAEFVEATGYVTESERFGWSAVFMGQLPKSKRRKMKANTVAGLEWWYGVEGAYWRKPEGPGSNIKKRMDHPVVAVSWNDAAAYAAWAGKRLPTEAEWEFAARDGKEQLSFPWGDELQPGGKHRCNVWQGDFPGHNTAEDGYEWTAPARSFRATDRGFYNLCGNVWEWIADWFSSAWHVPESEATRVNPAGPGSGETKTMKGGSFLCHHSYCNRYRVGARTSNTPDSATTNIGFRCAMSA